MKKYILVLLFLVASFFGVKAFLSSLEKPASGPVVVEDVEVVETEEVAVDTVEVEPVETPDPVEPEVEEEMFTPLPFTGKRLKAFAKANGGKVMEVPTGISKTYGGKKGVRVGGDFYFEGNEGLFVFHDGRFIKL